jgi:hypothetical protein
LTRTQADVSRRVVSGRRYYRSRFFITGVTLLLLGAGNAVIGSSKLAQYQRVVADGRARGYFPDAGSGDRILRPLDEEGERYNIMRAKVDLYHVVLSGGLLMLGVGAILTIAAWIRLRVRGNAGRAMPRPLASDSRGP